jgi:GntR family transcriptional regulator
MPEINRGSPESAAQQIASYYRKQIKSGELPAGSRLPTAAEMARDWDVSAVTVRAGLDALRGEGLIRSRQGQGVFVRHPRPRTRRDAANSQIAKDRALLSEDERKQAGAAELDMGMHLDQLDFRARYQQVSAPPDVAELLHISDTDLMLEKQYESRYRDSGLLAQKSVEWVPLHLLESNPRLLDENEEPWPGGGMHQFLTVGIELDRMDDVVTASMPTPEEQTAWGLETGTPMLRTRCVSYDTDGRPVSVSDADYPADRTELAFSTRLLRWSHTATKGE